MKRLWLGVAVLLVAVVAIVYFVMDRPAAVAPEAASQVQAPSVEITYIANEGVLISSGGKQVLIDGLHREYGPEYAFLPTAERDKIENAKAPFDAIDLILVSHRHLDHFHPESVGLHLQNSPRAFLVSSQQVVD